MRVPLKIDPSLLDKYKKMVQKSTLLAPNLREMIVTHYHGQEVPQNQIARKYVADHILAMRWCNPNAVVYVEEYAGQGVPKVEIKLWRKDPKTTYVLEIPENHDDLAASILYAAQDPYLASSDFPTRISVGPDVNVTPNSDLEKLQ